MRKSYSIGLVGVLALAGCMTQVDREAVSFPDMPNMPVYQRADGPQSYGDQARDALQTAESTCRTQRAGGEAVSSAVGSPAFDACMRGQGYRRMR
jgi:hypothetical protein